jgi:hypothetical protein
MLHTNVHKKNADLPVQAARPQFLHLNEVECNLMRLINKVAPEVACTITAAF